MNESSGMESSGVEWNRVEWNHRMRVEWSDEWSEIQNGLNGMSNGMEWNGIEWNGMIDDGME